MRENDNDPILSPIRLAWVFYPKMVLAVATSGIVAGFVGILLVDMINAAIHAESITRALVIQFVLLLILDIVFTAVTAILPAYLSNKVNIFLRASLYEQIVASPLERLEKHGLADLLTLLNMDTPNVARTVLILPLVISNISVFFFGIIYIAYQSALIFLILCIGLALGGIAYFFFYGRGIAVAREASNEYGRLNEHLRALVYGIKELKLNEKRRRWFRRTFSLSTHKAARFRFSEQIWFSYGYIFSQLCFLLILVALVLGLPLLKAADSAVISSCVLCIMFMLGPVNHLVDTLPEIGKGAVALERLAERGFTLTGGDRRVNWRSGPGEEPRVSWKVIELVGVEANYVVQQDGAEFKLGPVNLEIRPGELIYVVGGNGSGKSTLAKVLTGLYRPAAGHIRIDDARVEEKDIASYRSLFACVFSDFYLFPRVTSGGSRPIDQARAQSYLEALGLTGHVSLQGTSLSNTTGLSAGQRRRLALLCAYIEDRPIYLFDEWAADQDPAFKKFFYEVLLPNLKADGKCIVIITHDDQYFHHASRVIKMRDGQVESDAEVFREPVLEA